MKQFARWGGRIIFWALLLWVVVAVAQNPNEIRYKITDWWRLRNYEPSASVEGLATQAQLTDEARDYFYASYPELDDKETFNNNCPFPERSFVLGCYDGDRIYVLDVTLPELEAAEPVTAAHETLHAAWQRMDPGEKRHIGALLREEYQRSNDQHLKEVIDNYKQAGDDEEATITNELHSILPTELRELPPELEEHYRQYFKDRGKVVDLFDSYEAVFAANEAELERLKTEIDESYKALVAESAELDHTRTQIDANNARLNTLRAQNRVEEHNALVPEQNALIRSYNSRVVAHNASVEAYNKLVERYKALALKQTGLVNALDSKAEIR